MATAYIVCVQIVYTVKIFVGFTVGQPATNCQDMYRNFLRESVKIISHGRIGKSTVVLLTAA